MTFKKGQSGNPAGKPKGTRHKLTTLTEELTVAIANAIFSSRERGANDCCLIEIMHRQNPDLAHRLMMECRSVARREVAEAEKVVRKISTTSKDRKNVQQHVRAKGRIEQVIGRP